MEANTWKFESGIQPADMMAGLGGADKELLATCLALFDDSTFTARLGQLYDRGADQLQKWSGGEVSEAARELSSRQHYWKQDSGLSCDELRLYLWIRLREALSLPPRISLTWRGCEYLADDVTAALINVLDPPTLSKSGKRWLRQRGWLAEGEQALTLQDIVVPVLDELLEVSLKQEDQNFDETERRKLLETILQYLSGLNPAGQKEMLDRMKVTGENDKAAATILVVSTALTGFSTSVSLAGFSAYILAAKTSAFIPMVSGPGLVSFVSVLSNPITVVTASGLVGWWAISSSQSRIRATVASRVIAMLTIAGLKSGRQSIEASIQAFAATSRLQAGQGLPAKLVQAYQEQWKVHRDAVNQPGTMPDSRLMERMLSPAAAILKTAEDQDQREQEELQNAMALSGLTLGQLIYCTAAIDPTVIAAADFSRVADIENSLSFSQLAQDLLTGSSWTVQGGINHLKGYVAEKVIAGQLTAAGHIVSFPDASNSPGWDLLVDGQRFQVKFHATLTGIREHFDKYDYPVLANTELIGTIPVEWEDNVFFVDGVSNELVTHVTEHSLVMGDQVMNPDVPLLAFMVTTARGAVNFHQGKMTGLQAFEHVLMDGTVRVGLASAGGFAGVGIGFMLFGPAGAWVFAIGAPILAQTQTGRVVGGFRKHFKGPKRRRWGEECHDALDALQHCLILALKRKQEQLIHKIEQVPENTLGSYLKWRLEDELAHVKEVKQQVLLLLRIRITEPEQRAAEMLRLATKATLHPVSFQQPLKIASRELLNKPGLLKELAPDDPQQTLGRFKQAMLTVGDRIDHIDKQSGATEGIGRLFERIKGPWK